MHGGGTSGMNQPATRSTDELGYCAWLLFWGRLVVLGAAALLGAFFASADAAPGDETCGLLLAVAAVVLAFLLLKQRFDGGSSVAGPGSFLFVDTLPGLLVATVIFAALALAGLAVAAEYEYGGLHDAAVALAVVSALAVFFSIKHVFDAQEHRR